MKRPKANFKLYFADVNPEAISVRALADTLSAIQRIGFPEEDELSGDEALGEGELESPRIAVRVLDIRRGSAAYACVADRADDLIRNLRIASQSISDHRVGEDSVPLVAPLRMVSHIAKALRTSISVRVPDSTEDVIRFESDTYDRFSQRLFVRGRKSLIGNVRRVGGATAPRCALRLNDRRKLLFCSVKGDDTIQRLAQHLYRDAAVTGEATWIRENWTIVEFDIDTVAEPPSEPLSDAFDALRSAGADAWDSVADPEAFLEETTGT